MYELYELLYELYEVYSSSSEKQREAQIRKRCVSIAARVTSAG